MIINIEKGLYQGKKLLVCPNIVLIKMNKDEEENIGKIKIYGAETTKQQKGVVVSVGDKVSEQIQINDIAYFENQDYIHNGIKIDDNEYLFVNQDSILYLERGAAECE